MAYEEEEGLTTEEYLPIAERSFSVLLRQYEVEAAAARAGAAKKEEELPGSGSELRLVGQYIEDLANDARKLYGKLQACGSGGVNGGTAPCWSVEDIGTLRLLGFDVGSITMGAKEKDSVNSHGRLAGHHLHAPNLEKLLAVKRRMHRLQTEVDHLTASNATLRREATQQGRAIHPFAGEQEDLKGSLVALTRGFKALKDAYLNKTRKGSFFQDVKKATREEEEYVLSPHAIHFGKHRLEDFALEDLKPLSGDVEDAIHVLRSVDSCRRVRYCFGARVVSSAVADPVDRAVVRLLNDLDFPFPVQIRRLGNNGDYFIDRRVEIKLVDHQLLVRPCPTADTREEPFTDGRNQPRYEHLAKYLIHLYSPALDLDKTKATATM